MDVLCKLCVSNRGASVNRYRFSNVYWNIYKCRDKTVCTMHSLSVLGTS